ncbi:hypothetical protein [Aliarcobacter butzleri]|uniref:hypothetical protein n=1 Tax=Aliarcobacter butzleri TaxID=28197 RepID=UPI00126A5518|nr:hypothetical protein [Aliarcobacter butzleri]
MLEILSSGINLKYDKIIFNSLKDINGEQEKKIKAYHIFFMSLSKISNKKNILQYTTQEFNMYLDEIRVILSENNYILKVDEVSWEKTIKDSKKSIDFNHYLRQMGGTK